jgi:hypothetical protein
MRCLPERGLTTRAGGVGVSSKIDRIRKIEVSAPYTGVTLELLRYPDGYSGRQRRTFKCPICGTIETIEITI